MYICALIMPVAPMRIALLTFRICGPLMEGPYLALPLKSYKSSARVA